jgi:hypothetical protein
VKDQPTLRHEPTIRRLRARNAGRGVVPLDLRGKNA